MFGNGIRGERSGASYLFTREKNMDRTQSGFTLVEIIIVVVMLGILASVALPKILGPNEKIRASEAKSILSSLMIAQKSYIIDHPTYATALASLDITIPTSLNFGVPTVSNNGAGGVVASIARCTAAGAGCPSPGAAYTLTITDTGTITCAPDAATCAGVCKGGGTACN